MTPYWTCQHCAHVNFGSDWDPCVVCDRTGPGRAAEIGREEQQEDMHANPREIDE